MPRPVPVHNLRPNESDWTPPAVACFDTETRWHDGEAGEVHQLRNWAARLDVRRDRRKNIVPRSTDEGTDAAALAAALAAWGRKHPTLWVYAHNLAFDLTVSAVTSHLAELGYTVTEFAIDSPSPFVKMARGRSRITFADSHSWFPTSLDQVAAAMGVSKVELPRNDSDAEWWAERCRVDVDILADAMRTVMDWWDAQELGHWSVTGSASGWNVMRHKIDARRICINPSPEGIKSDRSAVYGGMRGLGRAGTLPGGDYAEADFTAAYPTIAEHLPLPTERMASFKSLPLDHRWITSDRHGAIARVRISTSVPRWPVRIGKRVWYPTGDYWTTLAGPDIAEAARLGCLQEIGAGWVHRLGHVLKPWAQWCLAAARGDDPSVPPVVRIWVKHCGRAVIGKWAQRAFETLEIGPSPRRGWHAEEGWNHTAGVRAVIVDFDGRRWQASASGDGDNCYPAVLAYVEAYVRVRLNRMIEAMAPDAVIAWDTDGMIIDRGASGDISALSADLWPLAPRIKQTYHRVEMIGPQHMILDGQRRFAGIPASAKPDDKGGLTATTWPKMAWQMGNSAEGAYVRPTSTYHIASTYAPGWVLDSGHVVPIEAGIDQAGENFIVPWNVGLWAANGFQLRAEQNKDLERYRDAGHTSGIRQDQGTEPEQGGGRRKRARPRPPRGLP
jgi:hypothetical protein